MDSHGQILDVNEFLEELIRSYYHLEDTASQLAEAIPHLPVDDIQSRCVSLRNLQVDLAVRDEKLIEILQLAGEDLLPNSRLGEYKTIFARTVAACDRVHESLLSVKQTLQQLSDDS